MPKASTHRAATALARKERPARLVEETETTQVSDAAETEVIPEADFEVEAEEREPVEFIAPAPVKELAPIRDREIEESGGDSMLARYFREMATHHVMGQEEELKTAIGVERAEVAHWVAILTNVRAADYILDRLDRDLPVGEEALTLPQLPDLRRVLKAAKKQRNKLTREQEKRYLRSCDSLARAIRLADSDRLWIAHAEEIARGLVETPDADRNDERAGHDHPATRPCRGAVRGRPERACVPGHTGLDGHDPSSDGARRRVVPAAARRRRPLQLHLAGRRAGRCAPRAGLRDPRCRDRTRPRR